VPTESGGTFLARIEPILAELDEAEHSVREEDDLRGLFRMSTPISFGIRDVIPRLAPFAALHPKLHIQLQLGHSYALWTYLTQPFLYQYPGFLVTEIEPWEEEIEVWRRLRVRFPDSVASHTKEQVSHFRPDGLVRRHDYAVDVLGGAKGAHYVDDSHEHSGIMVPHRRRVYPLGADNHKILEPVLITIDIACLDFWPA
jgi:hypothetical protein